MLMLSFVVNCGVNGLDCRVNVLVIHYFHLQKSASFKASAKTLAVSLKSESKSKSTHVMKKKNSTSLS